MARESARKDSPFYFAVEQAQRRAIEYALETAEGDWDVACTRLGLSQNHFRFFCERFGFPVPETATRRRAGKVVALDAAALVDPNRIDESEPDDEVDSESVEDVA